MIDVVEELAQAMTRQAEINADVNMVLANGLIKANDRLASLNDKLIETLLAECFS